MSTPRLPEEKSLADEAKFQEETRRLREELDEARRLRDEAQAVAENERRLRGEAEARMLPSTLPEFLDACHVHLSVGFSSRVNRMTGTQGQPENANFKVRPDRIRPWTTYSQEHSEVWDDLLKAKFMSESHFTSTNTLKELGKELKARSVGSELDLGYFERFTVEDRVALVIQQMYSSPSLRHAFNLKGKVTFENHGNTMSAEERSAGPKLDLDSDSDLERDGSSSPQSPIRKRRKKVHTHGKALPVTPPPRPKFFRPLVDQFCVYNAGLK
ncbi:hypothetical protein FQN57_002020 [Myotisia sp. PD_48]|nr:hypothetical protein FQN57_002020 [Myotisia sp. PD_48]